jgi:hypothetical protein
MKYIFIINLVLDINVNTNRYKLSQTSENSTGTNLIVAFF